MTAEDNTTSNNYDADTTTTTAVEDSSGNLEKAAFKAKDFENPRFHLHGNIIQPDFSKQQTLPQPQEVYSVIEDYERQRAEALEKGKRQGLPTGTKLARIVNGLNWQLGLLIHENTRTGRSSEGQTQSLMYFINQYLYELETNSEFADAERECLTGGELDQLMIKMQEYLESTAPVLASIISRSQAV